MAIDQRQISDLSLLQTKFKMGTIMEGDEVNVILSHDAASNTYKMDFVFPSHVMNPPTSPEPTDPEPSEPEDPTPTDPEPSEPEPSEPEDTGPEYKAFSACTVDEMLEIIRAGKAQEYWHVGDHVAIKSLGSFTLSNQSTDYCLQGDHLLYGVILGFNHNINIEHPGKKYSVTIGAFKTGTNTNAVVGFGSIIADPDRCNTYFGQQFYSALPFQWQDAILKNITKYSGGTLKKYSQGIFSLSYFEVHGSSNTFVSTNLISSHNKEEQYSYFKGKSLPSSITWRNPQNIGQLGNVIQSNFPIVSRNTVSNAYFVALNAISQNHAFKVIPVNAIEIMKELSSRPSISQDLRTAKSQGLTEHNSCLIKQNALHSTYSSYQYQDGSTFKYFLYLKTISGIKSSMYGDMFLPADSFPKIEFHGYSVLNPKLLGYFASSALFLPCFDIG